MYIKKLDRLNDAPSYKDWLSRQNLITLETWQAGDSISSCVIYTS